MPSDLPIIAAPPPPRERSAAERFGALWFLGIGGLGVLIVLVGWFGWSAWSMRAVWANVYAIHDASRPENERIRAAFSLARDARVSDRQRWDIALRRDVPPLARYVLAESLTSSVAEADPRGYALSIARSEGWPDWLRLLLLRPLAYAAGEGVELPREPLEELRSHPDPIIKLWACYGLAVAPGGDQSAAEQLSAVASGTTEIAELARLLLEAKAADQPLRNRALDRATVWLRSHHPQARLVCSTWNDYSGR